MNLLAKHARALQRDCSLTCYQQHRRSYTTEPDADEATMAIHVELATRRPQNAARLRSGAMARHDQRYSGNIM
jgi:hypothetical protein